MTATAPCGATVRRRCLTPRGSASRGGGTAGAASLACPEGSRCDGRSGATLAIACVR
jgi:hypothetical protein